MLRGQNTHCTSIRTVFGVSRAQVEARWVWQSDWNPNSGKTEVGDPQSRGLDRLPISESSGFSWETLPRRMKWRAIKKTGSGLRSSFPPHRHVHLFMFVCSYTYKHMHTTHTNPHMYTHLLVFVCSYRYKHTHVYTLHMPPKHVHVHLLIFMCLYT